MKKVIILLILAAIAGFLITGCYNNTGINDASGDIVISRTVAGPGWDSTIDKNKAFEIQGKINTKRDDADGVKIQPNKHNYDFPGIIFFWNDGSNKNGNDSGYLKIDSAIFDRFTYFILSVKESKYYRDYIIRPDVNWPLPDTDGCYIIRIPGLSKCGNKVLISEWATTWDPNDPNEPPSASIIPNIEGNKYFIISTPTPENPELLTGNTVHEVDPDNVMVFPWMHIPVKEYWDWCMWDSDAIFLNLLKNIKYPDGTTPTWIWDTEYESYFTQEGSKSVIYSSKFTIEGEIAEKTVPFYFACDNVAAVYVNGDLAGYTESSFEPY